jgi:Recombinase
MTVQGGGGTKKSEEQAHASRGRGGLSDRALRAFRPAKPEMGPPVGLVYRPDGVLDLDPDAEVQGAIRLVFETFERTGSAVKTVRFFREQGILFPRRLRSGSNKGELLWALPQHARILQVLHNPRYAGAFAYGRTRTRHRPDGTTTVATMPRSEWQFVMHDIHRGYIDWDRFEANQQQLADNARSYGIQRRSR